MKRVPMLLALAVAVTATAPGLTGVAFALVPPAGPRCTLVASPDPTAEAGGVAGQLRGGPLVAANTTMTLTCSVQLGGTGVHTDPDTVAIPAGPAANAVTLPPSSVFYYNPNQVLPTYVCTHVHQVDSSGTYDLYWDEASQSWSQNAATSYCLSVPPVAAPVYGGIVVFNQGAMTPLVTPFGVLADPLQWTCNIPAYSPAVPWTIACTPVSSIPPWTCSLVQAFAMTVSPLGTLRTSVDCDGNTTPEAQTGTASGVNGLGWDVTFPMVTATTFTCTFDNGGTAGPIPDFIGFCADPGLVDVS